MTAPIRPNHILLVEDDPAVASSLREGLTRAGFDFCKQMRPEGIGYRLVKET